jgi:hypothetical protein
MKRHLALKSEYVIELSNDELSRVAAGVTLTGYYPSLNAPCYTTDCFVIGDVRSVNAPCPSWDCLTGTTSV